MNYYIVVEGRCGEKIVYPQWIKYINQNIAQVNSLTDITENTYYLISGNGYPNYFSIIDNAIEDINNLGTIDCLVVAVDSEDKTYDEKLTEITEFVGTRLNHASLKVIIQNPCLETWALGNRVVFRRCPEDKKLREYLRLYNVRENDPELLPAHPIEEFNKAQFAFAYLKRMLYDRYPKLVYTKSNPKVLLHSKYFGQILLRLDETSHIQSFNSFLEAFRDN